VKVNNYALIKYLAGIIDGVDQSDRFQRSTRRL